MDDGFRMVSVRVTPQEMEAYENEARARGRDPRKWFRATLNEAVGAATPGSLRNEVALDAADVQRRLGVSAKTLNNYVRLGGLPSTGSGRSRRFLWKDVLAWWQQGDGDDAVDKKLEQERAAGEQEDELPAEEILSAGVVSKRLCVTGRMLRKYVSESGMPHQGVGHKKRFVWGEVLEWYVLYRMRSVSRGENQLAVLPRRVYRKTRRAAETMPGGGTVMMAEAKTIGPIEAVAESVPHLVSIRLPINGKMQKFRRLLDV